MTRGIRRDPGEKANALVTAGMLGSYKASELTGVPRRTIDRWREEGRTEPEIQEKIDRMVGDGRDDFAVVAAALPAKLGKIIAKALDSIDESGEPITARNLQALMTTAGILLDKMKMVDEWHTRAPQPPAARTASNPLIAEFGQPATTPNPLMEEFGQQPAPSSETAAANSLVGRRT